MQNLFCLLKLIELFAYRRRIHHFRRRQMRRQTLKLQVRSRLQRCANLRQVLDRDAQPSHTRVDLQMHRMPRHAQPGGGPLQQFDLLALPDCRGQAQADDFFFLAAPEPGHQQNPAADSGIAQRNRFIERSYALPARAFFFQRAGALDCAMAVGIRLHHRANFHSRTDVLLHYAKVVAQIA